MLNNGQRGSSPRPTTLGCRLSLCFPAGRPFAIVAMFEELRDTTIYLIARECERLFDDHLLQYGNDVPRTRRLVREYHQRYDAWLAFLGGVARDRLSLDHRLRHSPEVKSLVLQQLHVLKRNLNAGTHWALS